jgi:AcrR family transcriptional regulator
LQASEACVRAFAEAGGPDVSVDELARSAGISRRTFHRYFPTKESAVAPVMHHGVRLMADALALRPTDEPLGDALAASFDAASGGSLRERTDNLVPLLRSSSAMRAVMAQAIDEAEALLREPLAQRLGLASDDVRVTVALVVVTGLLRRSLTDDSGEKNSSARLREFLAAVDIRALIATPDARNAAPTYR